MFLLTHKPTHHAQDNDDAEEGGHEVGYGDDGLQEQLLGKLAKADDSRVSADAATALHGRSKGSIYGQHAGQHDTSSRVKPSFPTGLPRGNHTEQHEDSQSLSPSRAAQQLGVHDLLDDLLTQAQQAHHVDEQTAAMQQQQHPSVHQHPHNSRHVQHMEHVVDLQQEVVRADMQQAELQGPASAAAAPRSNKQLLSELLQGRLQPQQQQQLPAASGVQSTLAPGPAAASIEQQQKQQRSALYTGTSSARGHSTPFGRTSTPQRAAPKKKPRFSIKDIPSQRTPTAFATPQAKGQTAGSTAAGTSSGVRSLASILGSSAAAATTPNRPYSSTDTSKTPLQHGFAAASATPKHSTSKRPAPAGRPAATQAGAAGGQHTPQGATAVPGVTGASTVGDITPAALFSEKPAAQTPAAAVAAAAAAATPANSTKKRKGGTIDPMEVMSASRERQRAFLQSLPAVPAASGPNMASLQLSEVCVPLGSNLSKVWQQLQDARKKQQDHLEEHPGRDTGALELEVVNKSWEAHLVKCCCSITKCPPPPPPGTQPAAQTQLNVQPALATSQPGQHPQAQLQHLHVGQRVFVCVNSKASHSVELQPGSRVKLHPPWHVVQQQAGVPPVLLGHFLS